MKIALILMALTGITLLGCDQNNSNTLQSDKIELDSSLLGFANNFIKAYHCKQCLNDVTIDKITPDSSIVTIRSLTPYKNYFRDNPKRQKVEILGIPFFFYTGAEEYLKNIPLDSNEVLFSGKDCSDVAWTIIRSKGKDTLIKYGGVPFFYPDFSSPRRRVEFLPPDGKVGH